MTEIQEKIQTEYISLEVATLCKETGIWVWLFNNFPLKKVYEHGKLKTKPPMSMGTWADHGDRYLPAPTHTQLNDWLREHYKLYVCLTPKSVNKYLGWWAELYQLKVWNATYNSFMPKYITSGNDYHEVFDKGLKAALTDADLK